ncbi:hypothetical protein LCGC14_2271700, partial [marine sediment metagenome]
AFFSLVNMPIITSSLKASDKYFYLTEQFLNLGDYDYVYFPEKVNNAFNINRATKFKNKLIIETNKPFICDKIKAYAFLRFKNMQMARKVKLPSFKNITYIGRYACWDHSKKIKEVIEDVKNCSN